MIREFSLTNAAGTIWSLNRPNYCFLYEPQGLGYTEEAIYKRLGTAWRSADPEARQGEITGEIIFTGSDPYGAFYDFGKFLRKTPLTLTYITDAGTFYRNVAAASIGKTERKEDFLLRCPLTLVCTSLWYGLTYAQQIGEPAILTDITPDQLTDANGNLLTTTEPNYTVLNDGDAAAPFQMTLQGAVIDPELIVTAPDGTVQTVKIPATLAASDTLHYSSVDGDLFCYMEDSGGTKTNLVPLFPVGSDIFVKIPVGLAGVEIQGSNIWIEFREERRRV